MTWWLPFTAGIEDGLNPCVLMMCAVIIMVRMIMVNKGIAYERAMIVFVFNVYIFTALANAGLGIGFIAMDSVRLGFSVLYALFGVSAVCAGVLLFRDWMRVKKGQAALWPLTAPGALPSKKNKAMLYLGLSLLAMIVGLGNSLWPVNFHVGMVSNNIIVPGRFWDTAAFLALYSLVVLWLPAVLVWLLSAKRLSPGMERLLCAGFLFSAAATVFYIF